MSFGSDQPQAITGAQRDSEAPPPAGDIEATPAAAAALPPPGRRRARITVVAWCLTWLGGVAGAIAILSGASPYGYMLALPSAVVLRRASPRLTLWTSDAVRDLQSTSQWPRAGLLLAFRVIPLLAAVVVAAFLIRSAV